MKKIWSAIEGFFKYDILFINDLNSISSMILYRPPQLANKKPKLKSLYPLDQSEALSLINPVKIQNLAIEDVLESFQPEKSHL